MLGCCRGGTEKCIEQAEKDNALEQAASQHAEGTCSRAQWKILAQDANLISYASGRSAS